MDTKEYDVFISHASEDKADVVFPVADKLRALGVRVWYDDFEMQVGDSLSRKIDQGLARSTFGIVVISPHFLQKNWPEYELRGLISREIGGDKVILPIWHKVTRKEVLDFSPSLADKMALLTNAETTLPLVRELVKVIRPDIHEKFLRTILARLKILKNLKEVAIGQMRHGIPRHASLPQPLVTRIITLHSVTEEVLPISLSETIFSFRCDAYPEREIAVWERIAACYYLATLEKSFSIEKKKEVFSVLLAASMGPIGDEEHVQRGNLTIDEFESLVTLYDSNLSAIELQQP